ncbi:3967_t:CDS:1 [Acaulospora morrowiae]|uniref:3967_t:CDS:1 n=1 Tax=Acaulospora morrowiae TaxID=94023 RepID=A0A9N9GN84_9GLOM|nr:3967_t:CDS:1 [Acaulospora morrowiae]
MNKVSRKERPVTRSYARKNRILIAPLPPADTNPEPRRRNRKFTGKISQQGLKKKESSITQKLCEINQASSRNAGINKFQQSSQSNSNITSTRAKSQVDSARTVDIGVITQQSSPINTCNTIQQSLPVISTSKYLQVPPNTRATRDYPRLTNINIESMFSNNMTTPYLKDSPVPVRRNTSFDDFGGFRLQSSITDDDTDSE